VCRESNVNLDNLTTIYFPRKKTFILILFCSFFDCYTSRFCGRKISSRMTFFYFKTNCVRIAVAASCSCRPRSQAVCYEYRKCSKKELDKTYYIPVEFLWIFVKLGNFIPPNYGESLSGKAFDTVRGWTNKPRPRFRAVIYDYLQHSRGLSLKPKVQKTYFFREQGK
jgi:hypothetical protein